jgi:hypothetical protein
MLFRGSSASLWPKPATGSDIFDLDLRFGRLLNSFAWESGRRRLEFSIFFLDVLDPAI